MNRGTNRELFEISLTAEKEALTLYEALAIKFQALPEAQKFFHSMALDESEHINSIKAVVASISPETLNKEAPKESLVIAKRFLNFSAAKALEGIKSLEDAYRATVNLEFSEVNKVHELLLELHMHDDEKKRALYSGLQAHMGKVTEFKRSGVDMKFKPED